MTALTASDWSVVRIYLHFMRLIGTCVRVEPYGDDASERTTRKYVGGESNSPVVERLNKGVMQGWPIRRVENKYAY
eukprot:2035735-Pyramimonas_sp.AAC.1